MSCCPSVRRYVRRAQDRAARVGRAVRALRPGASLRFESRRRTPPGAAHCLRTGRAGGHERLRQAPATVRGEGRTFELVPRLHRLRPRRGVSLAACARVLGLGQRAPAAGVRRDKRGLRARVASDADQFARAIEPAAEGIAIPAGARERCQLRVGAQSLRAEPDAELSGLAGARHCQAVVHRLVGLGPPPLPQGQLCEEDVVDPLPAVLAQRGERGFEVRARGVEIAAPDLEVGAEHEEHVGEVRGDGAERGGTLRCPRRPIRRRRAATR